MRPPLGRSCMTPRELCALESAAAYNANKTIYLLTTNPRYLSNTNVIVNWHKQNYYWCCTKYPVFLHQPSKVARGVGKKLLCFGFRQTLNKNNCTYLSFNLGSMLFSRFFFNICNISCIYWPGVKTRFMSRFVQIKTCFFLDNSLYYIYLSEYWG